MKMMRHMRSGRLVVYDESLLEMGTYEVVEHTPEVAAIETEATPAPNKKRAKGKAPRNDNVAISDQIQIRLYKENQGSEA